jgi:hypothetical protein
MRRYVRPAACGIYSSDYSVVRMYRYSSGYYGHHGDDELHLLGHPRS